MGIFRRKRFQPGVYGIRFRNLPKYEYIMHDVESPSDVDLKDDERMEYIAPLGFIASETWLMRNVFPPAPRRTQE